MWVVCQSHSSGVTKTGQGKATETGFQLSSLERQEVRPIARKPKFPKWPGKCLFSKSERQVIIQSKGSKQNLTQVQSFIVLKMLYYQDFLGEVQKIQIVIIITNHHVPVLLLRSHSVAEWESRRVLYN